MGEKEKTQQFTVEQLTEQRDHARRIAHEFYEVMSEFPTSIQDFGIDPYEDVASDGWSASEAVRTDG